MDSDYCDVIHPSHNIAYNVTSNTNTITTSDHSENAMTDEAGYEVMDRIQRDSEYCESVLTANYSYVAASSIEDSEQVTTSYLNVIV